MKPLNENLRAVRVETEDGDLIPIMDAGGAKFSELIRAVTGMPILFGKHA
jgi:hypothetical protein